MATRKQSTIVGVFHDSSHAQEAIRDLKTAGFTEEQIGVISPDHSTTTGEKSTKKKGSHVAEGAAAGVAAGAGVGALWALGIAAGVLPVIGPVIAGGLLASVAASAAGGAAIAGIVGALVGLGIPEEDAQYYEGEFKQGRTIVTVKANGRAEEAWEILHRHGAYNRRTAEERTESTGVAAAAASGEQKVEIHEEQLHARKKPVKKGEVRVHKEVVTEQQTMSVPVTREEVVVERRPASRRGKRGTVEAGEIRIPVKEEQVHLEKETVVTGEVAVGKRKVTEMKPMTGSVRKEKVKVETEGEVVEQDDRIATNSRK